MFWKSHAGEPENRLGRREELLGIAMVFPTNGNRTEVGVVELAKPGAERCHLVRREGVTGIVMVFRPTEQVE